MRKRATKQAAALRSPLPISNEAHEVYETITKRSLLDKPTPWQPSPVRNGDTTYSSRDEITVEVHARAVGWTVTASTVERASELYEACRKRFEREPGYNNRTLEEKNG